MTTSASGSSGQTYLTVRELGGEIWSELRSLPEAELQWQIRNRVVDVVMGVLARHLGAQIRNDPDLPVSPLPGHSPQVQYRICRGAAGDCR
jgi:hypothetical protein